MAKFRYLLYRGDLREIEFGQAYGVQGGDRDISSPLRAILTSKNVVATDNDISSVTRNGSFTTNEVQYCSSAHYTRCWTT